MEKIKLQPNELQKLKNLQDKSNNLIVTLGQLEYQKLSLITELNTIQKEQNDLGKSFQEKYGDGNIDIETGEFTKSN